MSTLGASQTARRVSARQIAAIGVILLTLAAIFGVIGPVLPADATQPYIEATVVCDNEGVTINWTARSWLQDPNNDAASGNPSIVVRFDSVPVAYGAFTAANGYQFSGSNPWPVPNVDPQDQVHVYVLALAPFNNGQAQGSDARVTVFLPPDCNPTQETTTTTAQETTTTAPPVATTQPVSATTSSSLPFDSVPEVETEVATEVLGIQVSAPAAAQVVTQETLPFTGISTGSMALLAAAFAGVGLLLLLAARQNDEKSPVRSWN